jgi:hypothetical protein
MEFMLDTSPEAERVYYDTIYRMTPEERLLQANRLSVGMREMALESIRMRHPEYTDFQVIASYSRRILSEREFAILFPGVE